MALSWTSWLSRLSPSNYAVP
ncbi:hypothetical protein CCACVL1_24200 [Corchorus capsularis]|uniref:Uncharacterized protein n=1 Tax=Corchorus capsularis TaxID=210143 RepID=A0A1R3GQJ9_COCAP|nr:hypothetical protein CCACVL1_24200 [Corchorus capsularis]